MLIISLRGNYKLFLYVLEVLKRTKMKLNRTFVTTEIDNRDLFPKATLRLITSYFYHNSMNFKLLIIGFLLASTTAFAQNDNETKLDNKGIKNLSKGELSEDHLNKILNYNFQESRMEEESVIIKIVDGPHIEFYSLHKIETGISDPEKEDDLHETPTSDGDGDKHEHVLPANRKIKKLQIRIVDVFEVKSNN